MLPQPVAKAPVPQPVADAPAPRPAGGPRPLPRPAGFHPSGTSRPATVPDGLAAVAVAAAHEPTSALEASPVVPLAPSTPPQPAAIICPRCQSSSNASFPFCSVCGFPLQSKAPSAGPAAPTANPFPPPVPSNPLPSTPAAAPQPVAAPSTDELMRTGQYAPTPAARPSGKLVLLGKDGSDGVAYPLLGEMIDVGSREGPVQIPDDPYMSPRHARLQRGETGAWQIIDLDSVNGVYVRLRGSRQLSDGDLILLGQQVLRFEIVMDAEQGLRPATQHGTALFGTPQAPRFARLCQRTVEGVTRDVYHLHRAETSLGRETADIVFSDDPFLSRRHAVIRIQQPAQPGGPRAFVLEDHGSSNGTFVAIRGREPLQSGDVVRMGLHVFRIDLQESDRGARQ